jgi:hypothetical protein
MRHSHLTSARHPWSVAHLCRDLHRLRIAYAPVPTFGLLPILGTGRAARTSIPDADRRAARGEIKQRSASDSRTSNLTRLPQARATNSLQPKRRLQSNVQVERPRADNSRAALLRSLYDQDNARLALYSSRSAPTQVRPQPLPRCRGACT